MTFRLVTGESVGEGEGERRSGDDDVSAENGRGDDARATPVVATNAARPLVIYVNAPVLYAPVSGEATHARARAVLVPGTVDEASVPAHDAVATVDAAEPPPPRARGPWGEPVPEPWEFLPSPRRAKGLFEKWPRASHALVPAFLGFAFLGVSLVQWSGLGWNGAASGAAVYGRGEAWRLITALFAHGDLGHLGSNMLPFLFYGWMLQSYFGWKLFPLFAFVTGLVSNAVTVALYPSQVQLLGASGMIYGMVALWLVLYLRFDKQRKMPQRVARAVGFALMMLMPTTYEPQVSYLAHASGFAAGLTGGFIVAPFVTLRDPT